MLLFLPTRGTPYDLRFSLFRVPVTISPFFWVTAALLGFRWLKIEPGGPANLMTVVLCVLVSILIHEFGHALVMKAFRHDPEVVLYHFGGYASYRDRGRETPGRSLLISAAGPAAQFVLFAAFLGLEFWLRENQRMPEFGTPLYVGLREMLWINLAWPILNLLPVLPLDGGRMLHAILRLFGIRAAGDWAIKTSVGVGVVAAVFFLVYLNSFIAGAMFAFMAMDNYQTLKGQQFSPQ